jgi:hypothetical protein
MLLPGRSGLLPEPHLRTPSILYAVNIWKEQGSVLEKMGGNSTLLAVLFAEFGGVKVQLNGHAPRAMILSGSEAAVENQRESGPQNDQPGQQQGTLHDDSSSCETGGRRTEGRQSDPLGHPGAFILSALGKNGRVRLI